MSNEQQQHKENGNKAFETGDYDLAIIEYTKALDIETTINEDLFTILYTNRANARSKLEHVNYDDIIDDCTRALEHKPTHIKALYHRALAYEGINQLSNALRDWARIIEQDRTNQLATKGLNRVRQLALKQQSTEYSSNGVVNKIKDANDATYENVLKHVMGIIMNKTHLNEQLPYIKAGVIESLIPWCLSNNVQYRIASKRAMGALLGIASSIDIKDISVYNECITACIMKLHSIETIASEVQATIHVLSRVATHKSFQQHHLEEIVNSFLKELTFSSKVDIKSYYDSLDLQQKKRLHLLLSGLAIIASSVSTYCRHRIRDLLIIPLLFSPLASLQPLKISLLSAIVSIIAEIKSKGVNDDDKKHEEKEEDKESWKNSLAKNVNIRLLQDDQFIHGARALCLILQANQSLGQFIITHGGTKDKIAAPLQQILLQTESPTESNRLIAAELISLASQDATVRTIVVAGGHTDIFIDMLKSSDYTIRCNAAMSLSKLIATTDGKSLRPLVLDDNSLIIAVTDMLKSIQTSETLSEQDQLEGRGIGIDHVRLIVEILAYLSLHIKIKLYIATMNSGHVFQQLLALGTSKDRSIRFGIVKIFQNLCTSGEDIKASLNKELEQLREFASKGLGNKESNTQIADLAGSLKEVKVIKQLCCKRGLIQCLARIYTLTTSDDNEIPGEMVENIAKTMLSIASEPENRGILVQQKGLRLLLNLYQLPKGKYDACLALARVCISTNPTLFPDGMVLSIIPLLLSFLKIWEHELHQFETLLAITNLASLDNDIREHIMQERGWQEISYCMTSTNDNVQRACIEALANLVTCESALKKLVGESGDQDIKIFLACGRSDDVKLVSAATGALAMASHVKEISQKIVSNDGLLTILALTQNADEGVRQRVNVILENISKHNPNISKNIADTLAKLQSSSSSS